MTVAAMFYVRVLSFAQAFCWKRCHHKPTKELLPGEVSQDNGCYWATVRMNVWIPMLGDYYPKLYVQQWRCSCCFLGYSCGQGCQSWHQCNQVWSNKPVRCSKLSKMRCYQELWLLLIKNIISAMDFQEMLLPYGKANLKQVQHNSNAMKKAQSCLTCVCGTDSGGCSPWGGCKSYLDRSLPLLRGNLALMPQSGQDRGCKHTDMCWLLLR